MQQQSKTLQLMRRIGAPEPERIGISGILRSPELSSFTISLPGNGDDASSSLLGVLGANKVNIRYISKYRDSNGNTTMCVCVDAEHFKLTMSLVEAQAQLLAAKDFIFRPSVRVISLYPHKDRARLTERLLTTLRLNRIEPVSFNNASSVISCVLHSEHVEKAVDCLNEVFELP